MKAGESFSILSHLINFAIVIYFATFLLKLNALDNTALLISATGIFASLIANIMSVAENQ